MEWIQKICENDITSSGRETNRDSFIAGISYDFEIYSDLNSSDKTDDWWHFIYSNYVLKGILFRFDFNDDGPLYDIQSCFALPIDNLYCKAVIKGLEFKDFFVEVLNSFIKIS